MSEYTHSTRQCPIHRMNPADPIVCRTCAGRFRRDVRDLMTLIPQLRDMLTARSHSTSTTRGKRTPAPVRLDVLDLLDERGTLHATINCWTRLIIDERRLASDPESISDCLTLIWRHDDWLLAHAAAADACDEIHRIAHQVRRVFELNPEPPLGKCPELVNDDDCNGVLRIQPNGDVQCSRCHARWSASDLPHILRVVEPTRRIPVSREHVLRSYPISDTQLRQWVSRGHVRSYSDKQVDLLDVLARLDDM